MGEAMGEAISDIDRAHYLQIDEHEARGERGQRGGGLDPKRRAQSEDEVGAATVLLGAG